MTIMPAGVGADLDQLLGCVIDEAEKDFLQVPHERHYYRLVFKLCQWRGWDLDDRHDPDDP
jgi:hypothetical protein